MHLGCNEPSLRRVQGCRELNPPSGHFNAPGGLPVAFEPAGGFLAVLFVPAGRPLSGKDDPAQPALIT